MNEIAPNTTITEEDSLLQVSEPLQSIIRNAIEERATDVHLDPYENGKLVRFRIDGIVHEKEPIPIEYRKRILNQVKILTDLNIDKSFTAQEAFFTIKHEGIQHDIRVTIVPVDNRDAIHFRFLSAALLAPKINEIGLESDNLQLIQETLKSPSGLILVSGGTGAGKTTTMYSLADSLDLHSSIAASIEDPVEYRNAYIRQIEVDEEHGITMYEGLRTILRMDPDIILVGEIRDEASAVTAARAGLTGRLVIATIHARNAAMAIGALQHHSVPRFVVGGALRLVIQQDLVRRLCRECAQPSKPDLPTQKLFAQYTASVPNQIYEPVGCDRCKGYGYRGRIGIFEVTQIDQELGQDIASDLPQKEITKRCSLMRPHDSIVDVLRKVAQGIISVEVAHRFINDYTNKKLFLEKV